MATYTHFGKQPDVLKHLILCEVLRNEHPQVYVETNLPVPSTRCSRLRNSNMAFTIS